MDDKNVDYLEYIRELVSENDRLEALASAANKLAAAANVMRAALREQGHRRGAEERLQTALANVETWALLLGYNAPFLSLNRECIRREMLVELVGMLSIKEADHETD